MRSSRHHDITTVHKEVKRREGWVNVVKTYRFEMMNFRESLFWRMNKVDVQFAVLGRWYLAKVDGVKVGRMFFSLNSYLAKKREVACRWFSEMHSAALLAKSLWIWVVFAADQCRPCTSMRNNTTWFRIDSLRASLEKDRWLNQHLLRRPRTLLLGQTHHLPTNTRVCIVLLCCTKSKKF